MGSFYVLELRRGRLEASHHSRVRLRRSLGLDRGEAPSRVSPRWFWGLDPSPRILADRHVDLQLPSG